MIRLQSAYEPTDFQVLVERETERIELKTGAGGRSLQETMVAFSNTDGGVIFIGVDDGRQVHGRRLDQATDDRIHQAAADAHDIGRYEIREISVGGRPVVAVTVHRRDQGYSQTSDGRLLVRRGGSDRPLIGRALWEHMSARAFRRFERVPSGVANRAVEPAAFTALCAAFGWDPAAAVADRLTERGLANQDGELTIAGVLCLTDPTSTLGVRKFVVDVRRYPNHDQVNYDRREVFGGALPEQVKAAAGFVSDELGTDVIVGGLHRQELPKLPVRVVREAIANAVAHRCYELAGTSIVVEIRPSQVVVRSPGLLPEPVTVATMRQAQAARNPVIIDVLRRFGLAEDAGQGVDIMEDQMRDVLLDPPEFAETAGSVTVRLGMRGPITLQERAWLARLEQLGRLRADDRLLLVHAARGTTLTNAVARQLAGLDRDAALQSLQRLTEEGLLVRHGDRGGARYVAPSWPAATQVSTRRRSMSELEDAVLEIATRVPVRNEEVREITALNREQVKDLLARLVAAGKLVREGTKRGTRYRRA